MKIGKVKIILLKNLRPHERTNRKNLERIKANIRKNGFIADPIIVEQDNFVILDGHHRAKALQMLGYDEIPALLVDYSDKRISVLRRRPEIKISKKIIIEKALTGKVFPEKTSKHIIPNRPRKLNVPLKKLKKT